MLAPSSAWEEQDSSKRPKTSPAHGLDAPSKDVEARGEGASGAASTSSSNELEVSSTVVDAAAASTSASSTSASSTSPSTARVRLGAEEWDARRKTLQAYVPSVAGGELARILETFDGHVGEAMASFPVELISDYDPHVFDDDDDYDTHDHGPNGHYSDVEDECTGCGNPECGKLVGETLDAQWWDDRFQDDIDHGDVRSEWMLSHNGFGHFIVPHLAKAGRTLMVGCGNSAFSEAMYTKDGVCNIVNTDISKLVIDHMRGKHPAPT